MVRFAIDITSFDRFDDISSPSRRRRSCASFPAPGAQYNLLTSLGTYTVIYPARRLFVILFPSNKISDGVKYSIAEFGSGGLLFINGVPKPEGCSYYRYYGLLATGTGIVQYNTEFQKNSNAKAANRHKR